MGLEQVMELPRQRGDGPDGGRNGVAATAERPPAYQALADDLRHQITSGRLRPGERLPTEPELCARSGVSRSTVREALRLLASQHLIVTTRGVTGGSFVSHPSPDQLADAFSTGVRLLLTTTQVPTSALFEVRQMVEVPGVELAALRRTDEDLRALEKTMFDPAVDSTATMHTLRCAFHLALVGATHNSLYEVIARPLYDLSTDDGLGEHAPPGFWTRIDADHRTILRRIADRDAPGAAAAARAHLALVRQAYDAAGAHLTARSWSDQD